VVHHFNDLVGAGEQRRWQVEPERPHDILLPLTKKSACKQPKHTNCN